MEPSPRVTRAGGGPQHDRQLPVHDPIQNSNEIGRLVADGKTQPGELICQWCRKGHDRRQKRYYLSMVQRADRRTDHAPEAQTTNVWAREARSAAGEIDWSPIAEASAKVHQSQFSVAINNPTHGLYHGWLSTWRLLWDERGFRTGIDL